MTLYDDILRAFIECRPFPETLEISDKLYSELLRDERAYNALQNMHNGVASHFSSIPMKVRRYLVGWRVISERQGTSLLLPDADDSELVEVSTLTPSPRHVIKSDDFDEREALRYVEQRRKFI